MYFYLLVQNPQRSAAKSASAQAYLTPCKHIKDDCLAS